MWQIYKLKAFAKANNDVISVNLTFSLIGMIERDLLFQRKKSINLNTFVICLLE